jgi:signal transduction histidine kinase
MTLAESDLEMDVVRGQADLAAIVLHALCPEASDRTEHGFDTEVKSASRLLDQLQIGALEIDCDGHIRHHNEVFDQLFDSPAGLDSLADLIDLMEARSDKSTAASVAAYFRASSGSVASPALRLNFCLPQIGTVALTFERANPGSNDLSGCFLFSRVDARLAAGSEAFSAPIDLTLAGLDRLRSSMSAARSIWLKLEHEHHNELSRHGGFYLRGLSHHLDAVEQTLIDLEQLLSVSGTTEEPQKVNIDLVVDRIVVDLQTSHTGLSLNVRHTDLPSVTGQLHKITAALRHAMSASVARAEGAEVDISISAELADGNCSITLHDNGARMTRKQIRRAFDYVGPATADRDRTRGNRPVGLAQARALIRSMGGRMGLVPDGAGGTGVKMVFPEA